MDERKRWIQSPNHNWTTSIEINGADRGCMNKAWAIKVWHLISVWSTQWYQSVSLSDSMYGGKNSTIKQTKNITITFSNLTFFGDGQNEIWPKFNNQRLFHVSIHRHHACSYKFQREMTKLRARYSSQDIWQIEVITMLSSALRFQQNWKENSIHKFMQCHMGVESSMKFAITLPLIRMFNSELRCRGTITDKCASVATKLAEYCICISISKLFGHNFFFFFCI